jgi:hypothetical protein
VPLAIDARSQAFEDAEGEFIRNAGCATKTAAGSVYLITSGGKRLCQGNLIPDGQSFQKSLEKALKAWQELPATERKPGAASVGERGTADPKRVAQTPPADSLVLRVFSRQLGRDAKGELRFTVADDYVPEIRKHVRPLPGIGQRLYVDYRQGMAGHGARQSHGRQPCPGPAGPGGTAGALAPRSGDRPRRRSEFRRCDHR